jgi:adenylate cyclase
VFLRISVRNDVQNETLEIKVDRAILIGRAENHADGSEAFCKVLDPTCSRYQLRLKVTPDEAVLVENISRKVAVSIKPSLELEPLKTITLRCPIKLTIGKTSLTIALAQSSPNPASGASASPDATFMMVPRKPLMLMGDLSTSSPRRPEANVDSLLAWFEALISIQQSAGGSSDFYNEISEGIVRLIGLDVGMVLLRKGDRWSVAGVFGTEKDDATYSQTVLRKMLDEARTVYEQPGVLGDAQSLRSLDAVVASPITSINREIIGAVYGARAIKLQSKSELRISDLEAQLVQLLAACAGTGLIRSEREAESARLRVQFEEFCSAEVVRELQRNPDLLKAVEREITLLFCDVFGFSSLSERLHPERTYAIMTDILDGISDCVLQSGGIIIDFYGDAVAAMWNAPCEQADHAVLALRCAEAILSRVQSINAKWNATTDSGLCVGIGLHTGSALIGNVGGRRRLKYGPRGNTVNLASRIEGLTRQLGVPILCSAQTADLAAPQGIAATRIGRFQVVGINAPVDVLALTGRDDGSWDEESQSIYLAAWQAFEEGRFQDAITLLTKLIADSPKSQWRPVASFLLKECEKRSGSPGISHEPWITVQSK